MRVATLLLSAITAVALIAAVLWLRDGGVSAPVAPTVATGQAGEAPAVLESPGAEHALARRDAHTDLPPASAGPRDATEATTPQVPALEPGGLRVRVLDGAGVPVAGVPVKLLTVVAGQAGNDGGRATTRAPDGRARIGLEALAELRAHAASLAVSLTFSVAADVASASPVRAQLPGWPKDGDEVELRLPPSGTVRVRVLTRDGAPFAGAAQVGWWWVPADVAAADPSCAYERVPDYLIAASDGVAVIAGVGLGLTLQLMASAAGFVGVHERGIDGPREPGEVREVELRLGAALATLRLRALDPAGRPLSDMQLHGELWHDPDSVAHPAARPVRPEWLLLSTDAAGIATFALAPRGADVAPRFDITRRSRNKDAASDEHWSIGSVRLPLTLAEGEAVDLGDVRLAPVPIIVEGRVIDETGAPVPRAVLSFCERPSAEHRWTNLSEPRATTGADGRFVLRGPRLPKLLAVYVTSKGFTSISEYALEAGARNVELVLARARPADAPATGAIKVHVELEPDVLPLALILKLERPQGSTDRPDWWSGRAMQFDGYAPGSYDVWLETRDGGLELTRVEGVTVEAGKVTEDPRLLPLDARGLARTIVLELVRQDGTPWRRRRVAFEFSEERADFNAKTDDEGRVTIVLPRRITSLTLALAGQQPMNVALDAAAGPQRVVVAGE